MNSEQLLNEVKKSYEVLEKGGLILYPTDTVWGIGCDATNSEAVKKVYALKQRDDSKALICLVNNYAMLENHITKVPQNAYTILDVAIRPTTIIYDEPKDVAQNLIAEDNTLAIRIVKHPFCEELLQRFNKPIVSTSANISGQPTPKVFKEISEEILKGVDYIVNLQDDKKNTKPSAIIKLKNDGIVEIIRA